MKSQRGKTVRRPPCETGSFTIENAKGVADAQAPLALRRFPEALVARRWSENEVVRPGTGRRSEYTLLREFAGLRKDFPVNPSWWGPFSDRP